MFIFFFQPQPLHHSFLSVFGMPLQLLPGPVLRLRNIFVVVGRKMIHIGITSRELYIILQVVGKSQADDRLREISEKIFLGPKMQVCPCSPLITETSLVIISYPNLLNMFRMFCLGNQGTANE